MTAEAEKSRSVCDTLVTIDMLEADIKNALNLPDAKIVEWSAEDKVAGKGFLSVMAEIKMKWSTEDSRLPTTVMCKIPTVEKLKLLTQGNPEMEGMQRRMTEDISTFHNVEIFAYKNLDANGLHFVPRPKVYGSRELIRGEQGAAYLLMENLAVKAGHHELVNMEPFTEKQVYQVLQTLAKYHAWTVAHMDVFKNLKTMDLIHVLATDSKSKEQSAANIANDLQHPAWKGALSQEVQDKMPSLIFDSHEHMRQLNTVHREHGVPDVMIHGDMHPNNMLFTLDEQGRPFGDLAAMVDWQIGHIGNCCEDLTRLLSFCPPRPRGLDVLRKYVDYYYDEFCAASGGKLNFTRENMWQCFKQSYTYVGRLFVSIYLNFAIQIQEGKMPGADPAISIPRLHEDFQQIIETTQYLMENEP